MTLVLLLWLTLAASLLAAPLAAAPPAAVVHVPMQVSLLGGSADGSLTVNNADSAVVSVDLRLDGDIELWRKHHFLNVRLYNESFISGPWEVNATDVAANAAVLHHWFSVHSAGSYRLQVEMVNPSTPTKRDTGDHAPVRGSPFTVKVQQSNPEHRDRLPICTDAGPEFLASAGAWNGYWVKAAPGQRVHARYLFVPLRCRLDTFTATALAALADPPGQPRGKGAASEKTTWVVVTGSSVERGIFLTLLDAAIAHAATKADLRVSVVNKCWGWVDITVGKRLRVSYVDFRVAVYYNPDGITCHDEKVITGGTQLYDEGVQMLKLLFAQPQPPDLLWMLAMHSMYFGLDQYLAFLQPALDVKWKGTLVLASDSANPVDKQNRYKNHAFVPAQEMGPHDNDLRNPPMFLSLHSALKGRIRMLYFDAFPAVSSRLESIERGLLCYTCSNHFHFHNVPMAEALVHHSTPTPVDTEVDPAQQYVSEVGALAVQVILNALQPSSPVLQQWRDAPQETNPAVASTGATPNLESLAAPSSIKVCFDCPQDMLPFHVTVPDMVNPHCLDGFAVSVGNDHATHRHPVDRCPEHCLRQPVGAELTVHGGGVIKERRCKTHEPGLRGA